ncbi:MAG TPA: DUF2807 domain-containing protein [Desulfobacterales bacterium]|nr:DUF2807 domain-containing protein [Desulfobacterales bacterium]
MKRSLLIPVAAAALALAGCQLFNPVRGSGSLVTIPFDVGTFTRIEASRACSLHVVTDVVASLEVTCDDNIIEYLVVERTGTDPVSIGLKPSFWYCGVTFTVEARMPSLAGLELSGASGADVEPGFSSTLPLQVTLSGASTADFASIACGALRADISGASVLTLSGTADSERLNISGASEAHLLDCDAPWADVRVSGASQGWLDVGSGALDLEASGASTLYYRNSPSWGTFELSGGSRIVRLD